MDWILHSKSNGRAAGKIDGCSQTNDGTATYVDIFSSRVFTLFREMFPLFSSLPNKYLSNRIQFCYKKYPLWFMILYSLLLQYFQNPNEGPVCIYFLLITNSGTHLYYMYIWGILFTWEYGWRTKKVSPLLLLFFYQSTYIVVPKKTQWSDTTDQ